MKNKLSALSYSREERKFCVSSIFFSHSFVQTILFIIFACLLSWNVYRLLPSLLACAVATLQTYKVDKKLKKKRNYKNMVCQLIDALFLLDYFGRFAILNGRFINCLSPVIAPSCLIVCWFVVFGCRWWRNSSVGGLKEFDSLFQWFSKKYT
jgi:hypothetical protein